MTRVLTFGNGTRTAYARDRKGRLVGIATSSDHGIGAQESLLYSQRIEYDAVSRIVGIERQGRIERYGYDVFDRLIEVDTESEKERYAYDAVGNRTAWWNAGAQPATPGITSTAGSLQEGTAQFASYVGQSNRLSAIVRGGTRPAVSSIAEPWRYDATGNPVRILRQGGHRDYVYGANGRLRTVIQTVGNRETTLAEYRYNAAGERVLKQSAGRVTYYLYAQNKVVAEADAQGHITAHYVYWQHMPIAKIETSATKVDSALGWEVVRQPAWQRFLLWVRALTAEKPSPKTPPLAASMRVLVLHADQLGTPQLATDAERRVVWTARYSAFGAATIDEDPDRDGQHSRVNLRFPGQYFDLETGTHYNYFRDYDPRLGRYLQSDPIGLAGGVGTYSYVASSPLTALDPLGLEWEAADGSFPIWANRIIIGQRVHAMFGRYVTTSLPWQESIDEWQTNNTYDGTFGRRRPDAFNTTTKLLWELKPVSHRDNPWYRAAAERQIEDYLGSANRNPDPLNPASVHCSGWRPGNSADLSASGKTLGYIQTGLGPFRSVYKIDLWQDSRPTDTGLIFYSASLVENPLRELLEDVLRELDSPRMWVIWPSVQPFPDPSRFH